ncbi:hypothetical protein LY78DRAFT_675586 [Colletotrichum sublineola]|nr:hypothetical protein LY78DRAFT_675586 [Colletotrichum sublineola]
MAVLFFARPTGLWVVCLPAVGYVASQQSCSKFGYTQIKPWHKAAAFTSTLLRKTSTCAYSLQWDWATRAVALRHGPTRE